MNLRIGYVLLEFPRYSETFIANEILALAPLDIPEVLFSLQKPEETKLPEAWQPLASKLEYVAPHAARLLEQVRHSPQEWPEPLLRALEETDAAEIDSKRRQERYFSLGCAAYIARRARELDLDHLHCHYATLPTAVGMLVKCTTGIPYSFTGHAKDIFTMTSKKLSRRIAHASFAVSCSLAGRDFLVGAAPEEKRDHVHCVYHGIELSQWQMARSASREAPQLVAVGRLTPKKGFETLIRALALLQKRAPGMSCTILGEGRERASLEQLARELHVEQFVHLPGRVDQEEIRRVFSRATALVHPSVILPSNNQDGIANVVLEAFASQVPVVCSSIPALCEVVREADTGLLFEPGNERELARQIERLLQEPALGEQLAQNARRLVEEMTCTSAARQLHRLFEAYVS